MVNGMRLEGPPKRRFVAGDIVLDRLGREYEIKTAGMKYVIIRDGSWLPVGELRLKEPDAAPSKSKKLTPEEEFLD